MYNLISVKDSKFGIENLNISKTRLRPENKVYNSILELVGNTPLVKLNKIPKDHGLACEIYAKCEFFNPSGSVKDRIALSLIQDAKKVGVVTDKTVFVEPTSGNTGIGIAFNASLMDNGCIIVTELKNSSEKVNTMRLLGAEVIRMQSEMPIIAHKLRDEIPNAVMLDQFDNDVNPRTHYLTTAEEIIAALGEVDMVAMGAGTGGTMTGVGSKLKEKYPKCLLVAAEPDGSILINTKGESHPFLVEGIGGTWVPIVLDKSVIDHMEVITDEESFLMARELAKKEGLLCGGSSGTAMSAAIKAAKALNIGAGKKVVVILPDGIRNYMSKFVCDQWMEAHLFLDPPEHTMKWWNTPITELNLSHKYPMVDQKFTCLQALHVMKETSANVAVVIDKNGRFVGAISKDRFRNSATNPTKLPDENSEDFDINDPVVNHLVQNCFTLAINGKKGMPTIGRLSRILDITPFVVIGEQSNDGTKKLFVPEGVATGDDVFDYILACIKKQMNK